MTMYLDEAKEPAIENAPSGLKTTRRKVQVGGVQLFEQYYFHTALTAFIGDEVEVRYDVKDFSRVSVLLPDFRVVEATTIAVFACEGKYTNDESLLQDSLRLTEVEANYRLLLAACYQALEIRGIFAALRDPLILVDEKNKLRERYTEIEANIRAAIKNGGDQ